MGDCAMDGNEAAAVNVVLGYLGVKPAGDRQDALVGSDWLVEAAVLLAERASAVLAAGIDGDDVKRCWPAGPPTIIPMAGGLRFGFGALAVAHRAGLSAEDADAFEREVMTGRLQGIHPRDALSQWLAWRERAEPASES